jgi:hypothetical protein
VYTRARSHMHATYNSTTAKLCYVPQKKKHVNEVTYLLMGYTHTSYEDPTLSGTSAYSDFTDFWVHCVFVIGSKKLT